MVRSEEIPREYSGIHTKQSSLGETIRFLRQKSRISQGKLCEGLCSGTTLSRIEWGEREPDKLLTDVLLQRLGKSPDKFWTIVHIRDYEWMEIRRNIWEEILCGDYKAAETGIRKYEAAAETDHLHKQYLWKCKGLLAGKQTGNWKKSSLLFREAVRLTVPGFQECYFSGCLLGREELNLILLLAQAYDRCGEREKSRQCVCGLMENIQQREWDEEEFVKIYPKVVRQYLEFLKEDDKYEDVITLSQKATRLLIENGVIFLLAELMSCTLWGMERRIQANGRKFTVREEQEYAQLKMHVAVLEEVWEEYGEISRENIQYCTNFQQDVSVSNEIIRKCRKMSRMSQEQLSENICTVENLSRIERGRISPTERSYQGLMEKMDQATERNRYFVNVKEYEIHEKIRKVSKYINNGEVYRATELWRQVRNELDQDTLENRQCRIRYDTIIKLTNQKISGREAGEGYRKALKQTMPEFETINIKMWPLSRTEILLLTNIAEVYRITGQLEAACDVFIRLQEVLEESEVDVRYRATEYLLILYHLSLVQEELGNYEQSVHTARKGMKLCIQTGRSNMAARFLYSMAWALKQWNQVKNSLSDDKKEENTKKACRALRQAFYISNLLLQLNLSDEIGRYYTECFQTKLQY